MIDIPKDVQIATAQFSEGPPQRRNRYSPRTAASEGEIAKAESDYNLARLQYEQLQAQAYDAVIDLQGLTKSALLSWLAQTKVGGLRYAMANRTEGSAYEVPTRWAADRAIAVAASISSPIGRPLGVSLDQAIFSLPGLRLTSSRKGRSFIGWVNGSPAWGPSVASSMAALSRTVRLTTWWTEKPMAPSVTSQIGVRSRVTFMPTRPQLAAGMRIEPPPSLAWAAGRMPAATAAAAPPDDPPGV
mgnify:CR=1 FL=1